MLFDEEQTKVMAVANAKVNGWSVYAFTVTDNEIEFNSAPARITLRPNGSILINPPDSNPNWYTPITTGIGNIYWVRATITSSAGLGTIDGPTIGTWWLLSMDLEWTLNNESNSSGVIVSRTILFEFAASSGSPVLTTGEIHLTVRRTAP